jgi:hypothetical protein
MYKKIMVTSHDGSGISEYVLPPCRGFMNVVSGVRLVAPGREACLWHDHQLCGGHKPEAMEGEENAMKTPLEIT